MKNKKNKYILITKDLHENLIEFLDEIQFDIASNTDKDSMHKVNFISWAVGELVSSFEAYFPKKKSREDYVDETFMDWNLPEMSDEEYEKLVDHFDAFLRGWEKEYYKKNPKKKPKQERTKQEYKPDIDDVMEWCSLEEVVEFLKDDPELTDEERFELYYDERERRKPKEKGLTYNQLLKGAGIKPPTDAKDNKNKPKK